VIEEGIQENRLLVGRQLAYQCCHHPILDLFSNTISPFQVCTILGQITFALRDIVFFLLILRKIILMIAVIMGAHIK